MPPLDRCHAIVLAAGRGSRMGGPKALMQVNGRPWWILQNQALLRLGIPATWVVSPTVLRELGAHAASPSRLVGSDPDQPMFASLLLGIDSLSDATPAGIFVLPVDTPVPDGTVWRSLADTENVAIPLLEGKLGHPVYLPRNWVESTLKAQIDGTPDPSSLRLDHLIAPDQRQVPVTDSKVLVNLNTPDDLRGYLAAAGSRSPHGPEP